MKVCLPFAVAIMAVACPIGDAWARQEALLSVTAGQMPTDTASDGATKLTLEENAELGGKALKVVYVPGDSFGDRVSKITNWKPFIALEFDAFNPERENVTVILTVKHRRTTSYDTRVDMPVVLRPGKNSVKIGIDEMLNVNGTAPDLSSVSRWYIACEQGSTKNFGGSRAPPSRSCCRRGDLGCRGRAEACAQGARCSLSRAVGPVYAVVTTAWER